MPRRPQKGLWRDRYDGKWIFPENFQPSTDEERVEYFLAQHGVSDNYKLATDVQIATRRQLMARYFQKRQNNETSSAVETGDSSSADNQPPKKSRKKKSVGQKTGGRRKKGTSKTSKKSSKTSRKPVKPTIKETKTPKVHLTTGLTYEEAMSIAEKITEKKQQKRRVAEKKREKRQKQKLAKMVKLERIATQKAEKLMRQQEPCTTDRILMGREDSKESEPEDKPPPLIKYPIVRVLGVFGEVLSELKPVEHNKPVEISNQVDEVKSDESLNVLPSDRVADEVVNSNSVVKFFKEVDRDTAEVSDPKVTTKLKVIIESRDPTAAVTGLKYIHVPRGRNLFLSIVLKNDVIPLNTNNFQHQSLVRPKPSDLPVNPRKNISQMKTKDQQKTTCVVSRERTSEASQRSSLGPRKKENPKKKRGKNPQRRLSASISKEVARALTNLLLRRSSLVNTPKEEVSKQNLSTNSNVSNQKELRNRCRKKFETVLT